MSKQWSLKAKYLLQPYKEEVNMLRRSQRCFTMSKYTQKDKLINVCRDSCVKKKTVCVCVEGWTFFIKTCIVTFDRKSFWSDSWLPMTQKNNPQMHCFAAGSGLQPIGCLPSSRPMAHVHTRGSVANSYRQLDLAQLSPLGNVFGIKSLFWKTV